MQMATWLQCRCLLFLVTSCVLDYLIPWASASTSWEHLSLRYGTWYRPPRTPREAVDQGYERINHICQMDTYHGFLYVHRHNDKSRLIFDLNGRLSGIQTAIPGNMWGHNTYNETVRVPTQEVVPPILLSQDQYSPDLRMYTITAYFKHPSLICSPLARHVHPGKGLYIQMGYRVKYQYEKIPLDSRRLSDDWKTGTCLPSMGRHYFKRLSPKLPCERLYPVFLMYNGEGQLGGFGWLFQGTPPSESPRSLVKWFKLTPQFYPAIFDTSMLPACMYNKDFRVFGIRIYLRNEHTMTCPLAPPKEDTDTDSDESDIEDDHDDDDDHDDNDDVSDGHGRHSQVKDNSEKKKTTSKPVVNIPPKHDAGWVPPKYSGPIFNVHHGMNGSNFGRGHRGKNSSKNSRRGNINNNNNNVIVDDVMSRGDNACCLKSQSLLSLILMSLVPYLVFSNLSSSVLPTYLPSNIMTARLLPSSVVSSLSSLLAAVPLFAPSFPLSSLPSSSSPSSSSPSSSSSLLSILSSSLLGDKKISSFVLSSPKSTSSPPPSSSASTLLKDKHLHR